MNIYNNLYEEMKSAMKAKDQTKVLLLRGLIANIKNATINAGKEITDEVVLSCIKKNLKEIEQSIDSFNKAGRNDEVAKLNNDKDYLQKFLPKQLDEDELKAIINEVLTNIGPGPHSKKEMGRIMKEVMVKTKGAADGKIVSRLVSSFLV